MELNYICTGTNDMRPKRWGGHINLLKSSAPFELEVTARPDTAVFISCVENMSMETTSVFQTGTLEQNWPDFLIASGILND